MSISPLKSVGNRYEVGPLNQIAILRDNHAAQVDLVRRNELPNNPIHDMLSGRSDLNVSSLLDSAGTDAENGIKGKNGGPRGSNNGNGSSSGPPKKPEVTTLPGSGSSKSPSALAFTAIAAVASSALAFTTHFIKEDLFGALTEYIRPFLDFISILLITVTGAGWLTTENSIDSIKIGTESSSLL